MGRRAVADTLDPPVDDSASNADSEMHNGQRGIRHQNIMNFVSDQKVDIAESFERRKIFHDVERLPRNQRDYQETKTVKTEQIDSTNQEPPIKNQIIPNTKTKADSNIDSLNNINEIVDSKDSDSISEQIEDSFNTTEKSVLGEENRSGIGRKSIKSGGTSNDVIFGNELKPNSKLKKPLEDTENLIEDNIKIPIHKNIVEAVKSMRKKRNVHENDDISSGNRANDFKPSEDYND